MLRFVDQESEEELLLAGIKPLPINRMMRQAGREANDFYTKGSYGTGTRNRDGNFHRNSDGSMQRHQLRDGVMPDDLKQRTMERLERTQDAINNWDPIEASAQEDFNRMKGADMPDVRPIDTPSNPAPEGMFPGV